MPIYVGQATFSNDTSIRKRVQRHLTSARSDVIANRQIDVWEVAFVRAWRRDKPEARLALESALYRHFDRETPLMNGKVPRELPGDAEVPPPDEPGPVQVIEEELRRQRLDPAQRLPRQAQHVVALLDYILNVQDKPHLRRSLEAHRRRLNRHIERFLR